MRLGTGGAPMSDIRTVCLYCGSRIGDGGDYEDAAARLGRSLAEAGMRLVFGGGRVGLMGAAAGAALAAGGEVIGVIPHHLNDVELGMENLSELILVDNMHQRKRTMFELSDAFVTLPGGVGTLDETFEIISWRQLGLHDKPVILVDHEGYWQPLLALMNHIVEAGFASDATSRMYQVVAHVDDVVPTLKKARAPLIHAAGDLI